jgi:group I intron endonuclease
LARQQEADVADAGIYKIINLTNNKFYVGSAVNLGRRKTTHWRELRNGTHHNKHLQASWVKYGEEAFVFVRVIEVHDLSRLLDIETEWLTEHYGKPYCYNATIHATAIGLGKVGPLNPSWGKTFNHTPEAKAKIAASSRGRIQSVETRQKRRLTMRGHTVSEETRAKLRAITGEKHHFFGKKRPGFGAKVSRAVILTTPDGTATTYPSIQALREETGLKGPTVNRALKTGKPLVRGPRKGWSFHYVKSKTQ